MCQGWIILESILIENILILQDNKEVFYTCSLAAELLNKINDLGTRDITVDEQSIKCLEVHMDLASMGESEWRLNFNEFMSHVLLPRHSMTAL